ncbi:MAG: rhodanese-like domain-containing protein [Phycisphaerales bacterium]|nr:rhodanese-like domain-containing protein [Phycisphaerales bacterium]
MNTVTRAILQGATIGVLALVVGTLHAFVRPVNTWDSQKPALPAPVPIPVANGGGQPTQVQPATTAVTPATATTPPVAPHDERMVTLARFKELLAGPLPLQVVDAREPAEFAQGRIGGALNLPPGEFYGKIPDAVLQRLSRDLPIVVYCGGGNCDASKMVAMRLKDLGFSQTYVYDDGFTGWTQAGEAVEK